MRRMDASFKNARALTDTQGCLGRKLAPPTAAAATALAGPPTAVVAAEGFATPVPLTLAPFAVTIFSTAAP
jgi:hypothetical protein